MKSIVYIYRYRSELVSCLPGVVLFVGAVLGPRPLLCLQELSQTWLPTLFARRPLNGPKKSEGQCPQCKWIVPSHAEAGKDQHGFMDCIISDWIDDNWTVQLPQRHSVLHLRSLASLLGMGKEAENNHTVGELRPCGSPTRQRSLSAFRIFWKVCRWHKLRWGQASCTVLSLELVADGRQNQECRKQHEYRKPMNINENQPVDVSGIFADQPYLCVCFFFQRVDCFYQGGNQCGPGPPQRQGVQELHWEHDHMTLMGDQNISKMMGWTRLNIHFSIIFQLMWCSQGVKWFWSIMWFIWRMTPQRHVLHAAVSFLEAYQQVRTSTIPPAAAMSPTLSVYCSMATSSLHSVAIYTVAIWRTVTNAFALPRWRPALVQGPEV